MANRNVKKNTGARALAKAQGGRGAFQVNLSEEERKVIDRGAALAGLERSAFMRSESVKAAHRLIGEVGGAPP